MRRLVLLLSLFWAVAAYAGHVITGPYVPPAGVGGVSGGTVNCPYDTYADTTKDHCQAATAIHVGQVKLGSTYFFNDYAPQDLQNWTTPFIGSIANSVLTVTSVTGTPFNTATDAGKQTITDKLTGSPVLPPGVYIKSQISGTTGGGGGAKYQLSGSGANLPSGTYYAIRRPPYNRACIDYGCGNYAATPLDPVNIASVEPRCSYSAVNNQVSCGFLTADITLPPINWGPVGGHTCTTLYVSYANTVSTPYTITIDGGVFDSSDGCINNWVPNTLLFATCNTCGVGGVSVLNLIIQNMTINGHGQDALGWRGGAAGNLGPNYSQGSSTQIVSTQSRGALTFRNNYVKSWPGHQLGLSGTLCPSDFSAPTTEVHIASDNLFDTFNNRPVWGHGALGSLQCAYFEQYTRNTVVFSKQNLETASNTTAISIDPNSLYENTAEASYNTILLNIPGPATTSYTVTADACFSANNGDCGGAPAASVTFSNIVNGPVQPGMGFGGNRNGMIWAALDSDTWSYDCGQQNPDTECPNVTTGIATYEAAPNSTNTVTGFTLSSGFGNMTAIDTVHGHMINLSYIGNWIDNAAASPTTGSGLNAGTSTVCTNPAVLSGNININTGASIDTLWNHGTGC